MKDLYTFDYTQKSAMKTYEEVKSAYEAIFDELGLRYIVAEADSGNMGGKLSHEYHLVSSLGEDTVYQCGSCRYTANDEVVESPRSEVANNSRSTHVVATWRGTTADRATVVYAHYPEQQSDPTDISQSHRVDTRIVKQLCPEIDSTVAFLTDQQLSSMKPSRYIHLVDYRIAAQTSDHQFSKMADLTDPISSTIIRMDPATNTPLDLLKVGAGSPCPRCESGVLSKHRCIEIGHTFHLGTRYSEPMKATVTGPDTAGADFNNGKAYLQMGCHGIGVSRMLGALADLMADPSGLRWPPSIAPFDAAIVAAPGLEAQAERLYDLLATQSNLDILIDDRDKQLGWKLKDADLMGHSLVCILGRAWKADKMIEVQCRVDPGLSTLASEEDLVDVCKTILEKASRSR